MEDMKKMSRSLKRSLHNSIQEGDEGKEVLNDEMVTCKKTTTQENVVRDGAFQSEEQTSFPTVVLEKNGAKLMFFL